METNWRPIVNGDLSEVPRDKYVLFTVLNEKTGEVYTAAGKVDEFCLQHYKEDGKMEGIPRDEEVIFTVLLDEDTEEVRTASGKVDEYFLKKYGFVFVGTPRYPVETKTLKAWMKLPEPNPERCFKCNHGHLQHDEDSDNWFECELLQRAVPTIGKPEDCPLTEVD